MRLFLRMIAGATVLLTGLLARATEPADEVRNLILTAVKASGGSEKLAKLKALSWKSKGRTVAEEATTTSFTDETVAQGFDQVRSNIEVTETEKAKTGRVLTVIDGKHGWVQVNGEKTIDADAEFLKPRLTAYYALRLAETLLPMLEKDCKLDHLGQLKIAGRDAKGVRVSREGQPDVRVYFDNETGLVVRSETTIEANGQALALVYTPSEYKDFAGLQHFSKLALDIEGKRFLELELTELKPLEQLDGGVFAKP